MTLFKAAERYRDLAISPDGRKIYAVTASTGRALNEAGQMTPDLAHPGALLEFGYTGRD